MRPPSARRRRRRRAGAALLAALVLPGPPALAEDAEDTGGTGLAVEVGYDGRTGGAGWVPVTVTIQPDRLVAGTLAVEARTPTGGLREERAVEVAVGSRSAYRFVVPRGSVVATLDEGGDDPASVRAPQPRDTRGDFLAGMLGTVPAGAPPLRSEALGASGTWVGVDLQWAELSAGALQPLSGLVAEGRALAALSDRGLRNVVRAVADGMDLVVVGPVPDGLDLPWDLDGPAWALPTVHVAEESGDGEAAATVVPAGRGRLATTGALPGEGALGRSPALWSALVEPRPADDAGEQRWGGTVGSVLGGGPSGVPTLPWLAVFLVAYIVVVGPVNGLVLSRMGRRELAWVTVPAVTAVFTAAGWLGATGSQPPVGFTGSATAWVDGAASESVVAVARAPTPGRRSLTLPGEGWEVRPEAAGEPAVVRRGGSLAVDLDLPPLQPGGFVARRGVDAPPPLAVEATGSAAGLRVTVTNVGSETLSDVAVRAASASNGVGTLDPGDTRTVTVAADHLPGDDGTARDRWPSDAPGVARDGPGALAGVLAETLDDAPGLVWAVGTRPTSDTGVVVDGRPAQDRGGYVAVGVRATGPPPPHAVDRTLLDPGQDTFRPAPGVLEGPGPVVLRFRVPPGATGAALRPRFDVAAGGPPGEPEPDLWLWEHTERQWRPLEEALPGGRGGPGGYVSPLGEVHVRVAGHYVFLPLARMHLAVEGGS